MKKFNNLILGIVLTAIIYFSGVILSRIVSVPMDLVPNSFVIHSTMLLLSIVAIMLLKQKSFFTFHLKKVRFKHYIYGILIGFSGFIIANILATAILSLLGKGIDPGGNGQAGVSEMNSVQIFIFIFIYASISEEFLFRGFTQNFLNPLKHIRLTISKSVHISLPVIISGILFGLAHLILLNTETSGPVIFRIVLMTSIVGAIAGYFQEKHQNILPAIVIHMTANLPALIISFF
ncbi:MAG: CPBP family intramembrane metalloprotease [Bacteroidetes bacterium]|nr:CPBP family intramembrane metalloprotease [Bacteroidota bacterium]